MSPNRNYQSGRRFEYELMHAAKRNGLKCIRASGSHGDFDLVAYRPEQKPNFIQAKVCANETDRERMLKAFEANTVHAAHYHQTLAVKVKGKDVRSTTV